MNFRSPGPAGDEFHVTHEETRSTTYDAIVVGAGPAGCRAAWILGRMNKKVLLLDRQRFPRWKPCAGGLTAKAEPYVPAELRGQLQRTMYGAVLTFGDRFLTHVTTDLPLGWMVHRESFDQAHLELVCSLPGVTVIEGAGAQDVEENAGSVRVRAGGAVFTAGVVIGADGVNGVVSRSLPGHEGRSFVFAYEGEATFSRPALEREVLFDFRKFPNGYGWIFPKSDHYSIGGYVYERGVSGVARLYDEFCAESSRLAGCPTFRRRGYRIPRGGGDRKLNSARMLLAGDAADLVDPLTGEGIYYALRSGQLAAESAAAFLDRGEPLDGYSRQVREEIQNEFRTARKLASLLWGHRRVAYFLFMKNRTVCRWLTEILIGRRSYRSLRRELLTRGWLLPLQFRPGARQRVNLQFG
jgi:geranylgeranyl reductase family protein